MIQRLSRIVLMAVTMAAMVLASPVSADIAVPNPNKPRPKPAPAPPPPPPKNEKAVDLPLTVKMQDNAKPMKLELPQQQAEAAKAAVGAEAAGDAGGASGTRTIIAALMLSLGAMAGGLWLARKRSRGVAIAVATVMVIAAAGLLASEAFGNRAPPPQPPPFVEKPPKPAGLSIRIEPVGKGEAAVLHISEEQLKSIIEQVAAQKKAAAEAPVVPGVRSVPQPPG